MKTWQINKVTNYTKGIFETRSKQLAAIWREPENTMWMPSTKEPQKTHY